MARIQVNLRVTNKSCRRCHCIIDTYQLIHQRRFPLVSSLDKTYQQRTKNVPPGSEQIFGDDLPKRILGIKNNKQLFEKEKTYYSNQKNFKRFPQNPGNHYQKGYQQHQNSNHYRNRPDSCFRQKGKFPKKHN